MRHRMATMILLIAVALIAVGLISYVAVDRYLLDHADAIADPSTQEPSANSQAASGEPGSATTAPPSADAGGETSSYMATDTAYRDATKSISIAKVTTGSGPDTVTYYVADVTLSSGTDLQAAFAGGRFDAQVKQDTSEIAVANDAIFAVNGDYYGAREDGVIIRNGVIYRNVPARMGLALYEDGTMEIYDETRVSADQLLAEGVWNTYSFGPPLLDDGAVADNLEFVEVEVNPKHPIQGRNPRTGIGIIDKNHFVFVVVDGRRAGYSKGVTLIEFAQIFADLGCSKAYNLDGGGSSTMYFIGDLVNNPLGKSNERAISDILLIR